MLRVISFGAGVQSTTMALMAAHGEIGPMPDFAVFADTGWEPKAVYEHLNFMTGRNVLPFPVGITKAGNLRDDLLRGVNSTGQVFSSVPWFSSDGGMGRRQCTKEYKIVPIKRAIRREMAARGIKVGPGRVEQWIGISTDEAMRVNESKVKYIKHRYPLIELGMSRLDCLAWIAKNGYPEPPKSSCIGCPFKSDAQWRQMRDEASAEWNDAIFVDRVIRTAGVTTPGIQQFMHRTLRPLDEVDLAERPVPQLNMFNNECLGMCGV